MLRAELRLPADPAVMEAGLEGLTRANEAIIRARRGRGAPLPALAASGVRYARMIGEVWRPVTEVIASGYANCHDLAAWRAAELRATGRDPRARVRVYKVGPHDWHAIVETRGRREDPSRMLGMGQPGTPTFDPRGLVPRGESIMDDVTGWEDGVTIGEDPAAGLIDLTWSVERTPSGWRGTVRVPIPSKGKAIYVSKNGPTKASAAKSALSAAEQVMNSPIVASLVPPEARFAVNLVRSETARNVAKKILSLF